MDTTAASYCIAAQGGTIGGHYRSQLLYRSPKGGPLVDTTTASYCIAAQGGTIGGHYHGGSPKLWQLGPGGGMIGTIFIYFFSHVSLLGPGNLVCAHGTILTNRESSELVAEHIFCALQVRTWTI